jgi:glycosyltransferase involved in cell wall biosynthesis
MPMASVELLPAMNLASLSDSEREKDTLHVLHVINGEHYAGAERVQDLLAQRLPEFGIDAAFACVKPGKFAEARHARHAPVIDVPMRARFDVRPAWKLAEIIRQRSIDLIHTHTPRSAMVGHLAARMAGVPWIHHVHGHTATEVGAGFKTWLSARIETLSLAGAAAVIAVSPTSAQYIRKCGVSARRINIIPNGVPGCDALPKRDLPREGWTLGVVALFRPRKGLEVLLEALAKLNRDSWPVRLRVIGSFESADYESHARAEASRLGIEQLIEWRGFRQDVNAELDELDLLVLPSVLAEGMPMVVLEAMAAGVPPIGSRVAGIADVIEHGENGLLFAPGDAAALAGEIASILDGRRDWQRLRHSAFRTHAERYSDRIMAEQVANLYRKVLQS